VDGDISCRDRIFPHPIYDLDLPLPMIIFCPFNGQAIVSNLPLQYSLARQARNVPNWLGGDRRGHAYPLNAINRHPERLTTLREHSRSLARTSE